MLLVATGSARTRDTRVSPWVPACVAARATIHRQSGECLFLAIGINLCNSKLCRLPAGQAFFRVRGKCIFLAKHVCNQTQQVPVYMVLDCCISSHVHEVPSTVIG